MVNKSVSRLNSTIKFLRLSESKRSNSPFDFDVNNILPKSKHSQGHIEVILSMTLFIGFLIFIFIFLNPAFRTKQELPIKDIQDKFIERVSAKVGKLSVIVNKAEEDCYSLKTFSKEVKDKYFIEVHDSENPRRYTIYYGEANLFDADLIGIISCTDKIGRDFYLGSYTEESIIVYEKIKELREEYENNHDGLKESLNIGDFSFNVMDIDRNEKPELTPTNVKTPQNVDVVSKDIPIRVMNNQAEISEYILNLKTWK